MPLQGADAFLTNLMGEVPSTPAVLYLRSAQSPEGRACVGVFVGSQQVGHLPADAGEALLATVQACELNGAVARARGNLIASQDLPGQVRVQVSLADSERLLSAPASASGSSGAAAAPLAAGHTEDYPDWPPPKPKADTAAGPFANVAPAPSAEAALPPQAPAGSLFAPAPPKPAPAPLQTTPSPSPLAPVSAGSAWLGGSSTPSPAPESGWLGSAGQSTQVPTATAMSSGAASAASEGTAVPGQNQSWLGLADQNPASRSPEEEIIAAWTSSPRVQPAAPVTLPSSSRSSKTWILTALMVVVLAAAAFLVYKVMFAPKTYTDEQFGYSFSYPHGWGLADENDAPPGSDNLARLVKGGMLSFCFCFSPDKPAPQQNEFAAAAVVVYPSGAFGNPSQLTADLRAEFDSPALARLGGSVVEPLTSTDLGGLAGYRTTIALPPSLDSARMTICFAVGETHLYMLYAMAGGTVWEANQKTFDRFFESFKPGATKQ